MTKENKKERQVTYTENISNACLLLYICLHLVSSQVERSESVPAQSGRTQTFEHQGADTGLVTWTHRCNVTYWGNISLNKTSCLL